MITHDFQLNLFNNIASRLSKKVECWAFGGTAMMFYGYKNETKDIDLLFENEGDRQIFIKAIKDMGFNESNPFGIYIEKKLENKGKPIMFKFEDVRFDLFCESIFKTKLSPKMSEDKFAVHEFGTPQMLIINVVRKEHIVFLKSVTDRTSDINDAASIVEKDKNFDWQYLVDEVLWQYNNGNDWALLDAEKMMKELKEYIIIPEKYFKMIYEAKK